MLEKCCRKIKGQKEQFVRAIKKKTQTSHISTKLCLLPQIKTCQETKDQQYSKEVCKNNGNTSPHPNRIYPVVSK